MAEAVTEVSVDVALRIAGDALKLEPGCTYAIEMTEYASRDAINGVADVLAEYGERTGIKFIVLPKDMKIARERAV